MWDEKSEAQLRRLYDEGMSSGKIAEKMGVTRNTIVGKTSRMGLRRAGKKPVGGRPKVQHGGARGLPGNIDRIKTLVAVAAVKATEAALPVVDVGGVAMVDLEWHHCRWPLDNGRSCGQRKERGSYCAEHGSRAYAGVRLSGNTKPARRSR